MVNLVYLGKIFKEPGYYAKKNNIFVHLNLEFGLRVINGDRLNDTCKDTLSNRY